MGNGAYSEGFISYNESGAIGTDISYNRYSATNPITKLYDNIYFDKSNGYLIEFDGSQSVVGAPAVAGGEEQIKSIRVYPRASAPTDHTVTSSLEVVKTAGPLTPSNIQFVSETTSGSMKYSTIYVAFDTTTYVHIINTSELKDLETFKLTSSSVDRKTHNESITISDVRNNTKLVTSADDGSYIESTKVIFTRPVQKLGTMFYYDLSSGAAMQVRLEGKDYADSYINVYLRPTGTTSDFQMKRIVDSVPPSELGKIESANFATKLYQDEYLRMVQIVDGAKTVMILYYLSNAAVKIHSVYRYNSAVSVDTIKTVGDKTGTSAMTLEQLTQLFLKVMEDYNKKMGESKKGSGSGIDDISDKEEYAKWLAYWNTEANRMPSSGEYILKTAVVPPICPTCPSCPSCGGGAAKADGTCTNCGTKTDASGSASGSAASAAGIQAGDSELTRLAASTGRGIKEIATGATTGAVGLARETVGGATGLAKETVGGTVGLAKETVGGAVGLAKETVGGALGLVREAGGEVKGLFKGFGPTQVRDIQMGGEGQQAGGFGYGEAGDYGVPARGARFAGSDPYSYNGSLVSKGGNFIPITADFSRFGR